MSARKKCKGGEERQKCRERERERDVSVSTPSSVISQSSIMTPKRLFLFLFLCISISLLRLYTFFSRSQSVIKFSLKMRVSSKELFSTLKDLGFASISSCHKSADYHTALPNRNTLVYNTHKSRYLNFHRAIHLNKLEHEERPIAWKEQLFSLYSLLVSHSFFTESWFKFCLWV